MVMSRYYGSNISGSQQWGGYSDKDGDGNENGKKAIGLYQQNNNFARASRFFVYFLAIIASLRHETS